MLPAIKAMWDKEEALTLEQRRKRYKCKEYLNFNKTIIILFISLIYITI